MIQTDCPSLCEKDIHKQLLRLISYSGRSTFHLCERRFQLDKLRVFQGGKEESVDFSFGAALGTGAQMLWLFSDLNKAKIHAAAAWKVGFAEEKEKSKKSLPYLFQALDKYYEIYKIQKEDWELAEINGVPAVEYSMQIELPGGFVYRAFVDFILKNKETGELKLNEMKSDGGFLKTEARYKNSDQSTSYALLLDHIAPDQNHFWVDYPVYYSASQEWEIYSFAKGLMEKARWLKTLMRDIKAMRECEEENYWPMRGQSCFAYNRPCQYFEACNLKDEFLISSPKILSQKLEEEETQDWKFKVDLETVLKNYLGIEGLENETV